MFGIVQKRGAARAGAKPAALHSIASMMRGRGFAGQFEVSGASYSFTYSPAKAAVVGGKLELVGGISVGGRAGSRPVRHEISNVRATLLATQGGIGSAPPRKKPPDDVMAPRTDLPVVESTGPLSFAGVLYFKLAPLNGRALGVAADLNNVQLNVRLAPVNDAERAMQSAFSSIVEALYGQKADPAAATEALQELNKLLVGN